MERIDLKKVIKLAIDSSCTHGDFKDVKKAFKDFKTEKIYDLLADCTDYMGERVYERKMYIDDYSSAEITAFSAEDYVMVICAYVRTIEGAYMRVHYRRVYGYFAFSYKDGVITLSEATPIVDVPDVDAL